MIALMSPDGRRRLEAGLDLRRDRQRGDGRPAYRVNEWQSACW
jgi:hypothetical protein